jgi:uncharacterized OB-fold protein
MENIDLGERPKEGLARRECEDCGIMFTPKKPHYIRCSDCIAAEYVNENEDEELPEVRF